MYSLPDIHTLVSFSLVQNVLWPEIDGLYFSLDYIYRKSKGIRDGGLKRLLFFFMNTLKIYMGDKTEKLITNQNKRDSKIYTLKIPTWGLLHKYTYFYFFFVLLKTKVCCL